MTRIIFTDAHNPCAYVSQKLGKKNKQDQIFKLKQSKFI